MHKPETVHAVPAPTPSSTACAGIDVSKDHLDGCCFSIQGQRRRRRFKNAAAGHRRLLGWLGAPTRVVVESTGRYGLDVTLALHAAEGIEVMVANPKALRGYAKAQMRRTLARCGRRRGDCRLCPENALFALAAT